MAEQVLIQFRVDKALKQEIAGITQKELVERLQVYQKDISGWENNELTPNALTLARICKELGHLLTRF